MPCPPVLSSKFPNPQTLSLQRPASIIHHRKKEISVYIPNSPTSPHRPLQSDSLLVSFHTARDLTSSPLPFPIKRIVKPRSFHHQAPNLLFNLRQKQLEPHLPTHLPTPISNRYLQYPASLLIHRHHIVSFGLTDLSYSRRSSGETQYQQPPSTMPRKHSKMSAAGVTAVRAGIKWALVDLNEIASADVVSDFLINQLDVPQSPLHRLLWAQYFGSPLTAKLLHTLAEDLVDFEAYLGRFRENARQGIRFLMRFPDPITVTQWNMLVAALELARVPARHISNLRDMVFSGSKWDWDLRNRVCAKLVRLFKLANAIAAVRKLCDRLKLLGGMD